MPLFVLTCIDKPNSLEVRLGAREAHLEYVRRTNVTKLGGPFLDAQGAMAGSMLIIEVADLAAAKAFAAADPYALAGLFESADIRPYKVTIGEL